RQPSGAALSLTRHRTQLRRRRPGDVYARPVAARRPASGAGADAAAPGRRRPTPGTPAHLRLRDDRHLSPGGGRAHAARRAVGQVRSGCPVRPAVRCRDAPDQQLSAPDGTNRDAIRGVGGADVPLLARGRAAVSLTPPDARPTRDHLAGLFAKMAARRIVVVGDAMLDVYLEGDAERISPEAPVPVVAVRTRRTALGGAANVAANVAAIGAECRLVAVIGDDARGDSFRAELAQNRLRDEHIVVAAARPTTSKTRVTARGQQVVRIDEEVEDPIPPRTEEQLAAKLQRAMADRSE